MMSGADELDELSHELAEFARTDAQQHKDQLSVVEQQLAVSLGEGEELFHQEQ